MTVNEVDTRLDVSVGAGVVVLSAFIKTLTSLPHVGAFLVQ